MALIVRGLKKTYGTQVALSAIDFALDSGVVALLGANGSGKSTLLRVLATLAQPDSGDLSFMDQAYNTHQRHLRAHIGYLPQELELPDSLTPRKFLAYLSELRGGDPGTVLDVLQLQELADHPFSRLSGGQLRRVGIAQAFLGSPRLLLLDELARGLDVTERERVFRLVGQHPHLAIFSTHIPAEAERLAHTVIVLHHGRLLFCGPVDTFRSIAAGQVYESAVPADLFPSIPQPSLTSRITPQGDTVILRFISATAPCDFQAIPASPTLEDAYLLLTHRAAVERY